MVFQMIKNMIPVDPRQGREYQETNEGASKLTGGRAGKEKKVVTGDQQAGGKCGYSLNRGAISGIFLFHMIAKTRTGRSP
jgi:hypothetical protein